ncbi:phospholipase D family protein [Micromonospora sp. NPDC051196]|uniref:phospholipase D family protein n=1 Tax=Micromonospora sp. NPDC051196 TaxID=3155281 RepID=UPI00343565EE
MRYLDTGARDPEHALGTWLDTVLLKAPSVVAVRLQTGFFGADALGYFEPTLARLAVSGGLTRMLIGSNDGETTRASLEKLITMAGAPRAGLSLAVVSFANAFFHPKVFHFTRADGSATAYVGSANLTRAGVTAQHVESGIIVDTRDGDSPKFLKSISDAIDGWFMSRRSGFYPFSTPADLDALAQAKIIDVMPPPRPERVPSLQVVGKSGIRSSATLTPLVQPPATTITALKPIAPRPRTSAASAMPAPAKPPVVVHHWSKKLSASDAQRKGAGNQRGAVTLVQGHYRGRIDQRTYFRNEIFQAARWHPMATATGLPMDKAIIPMDTTVKGVAMGVINFEVTYAANRESAQNNYTSTLHLEPLTPLFQQQNMTNRRLEIESLSDGTYRLTIS